MAIYSAEAGCKGRVIDLNTGKEVVGAFWLDDEAGEVRVPKVSGVWKLWLATPEHQRRKKFPGGPPPKVEAEPVLDEQGRHLSDAQGRPRYRAVSETIKGRFRFEPA